MTGWCASCGCGWNRERVDAFDVTPPESECRNPKDDCHQGFWDAVDEDPLPAVTFNDRDELEKRRLYGDR